MLVRVLPVPPTFVPSVGPVLILASFALPSAPLRALPAQLRPRRGRRSRVTGMIGLAGVRHNRSTERVVSHVHLGCRKAMSESFKYVSYGIRWLQIRLIHTLM